MNKSLAIIVAVGLTLGCDDPAVNAKALDVLEFGAVQAKVECVDVPTPTCGVDDCQPCGNDRYVLHAMADGSAIVLLNQQTWIYGRVEPQATTGEVTTPGPTPITRSVSSGELTVERSGCSSIVIDIETQCTGFNLDTFD